MNGEKNTTIIVHFKDGTQETFVGYNYRLSYIDHPEHGSEPPCIRMWRGSHTEIIPMDAIKRISMKF